MVLIRFNLFNELNLTNFYFQGDKINKTNSLIFFNFVLE